MWSRDPIVPVMWRGVFSEILSLCETVTTIGSFRGGTAILST